jgi:hypothetical protein
MGDPVDLYAGFDLSNITIKSFARNLFEAGSNIAFVRNTVATSALNLTPDPTSDRRDCLGRPFLNAAAWPRGTHCNSPAYSARL